MSTTEFTVVPFLDLNAHHSPKRAELMEALEEVIDSGAFSGGPFVARFEEDFARYCGVDHAVGVGSGTDALWLALLSFGVGPGDEVVTVPMTFVATVEAIIRTGARPVFVDIDESSYTMDPGALERAITPRTKAIVPVHLFGRVADMKPILEIAKTHGLIVVEDAAQAHGAQYDGCRAGSLGDAGCFSFYPGKNLGAFGEAGAIVTNHAASAERMRILRDHGRSRHHHHTEVGWNCRMDGLQAAVLRVKLRDLDRNNELRRRHARHYAQALCGLPQVILPTSDFCGIHAYHLYVVRVTRRHEFVTGLARRGIQTAIHYPCPVHLQSGYASLGFGPGSFPIAERSAAEFVSLPMYPELTPAQLSAVTDSVWETSSEALDVQSGERKAAV